MPYVLVKSVKGGVVGYRVRKQYRPFKYFSKHPLPLEMAKRQMRALYLSERLRGQKKSYVTSISISR